MPILAWVVGGRREAHKKGPTFRTKTSDLPRTLSFLDRILATAAPLIADSSNRAHASIAHQCLRSVFRCQSGHT